jgi:Peptidase family M23
VINHHHSHPAQRFAVDINELDGHGRRAAFTALSDVGTYGIYGKAVFSPCDGRVRNTRDGSPDEVPPEGSGARAAGNFVAIDCGEVTVLLAHLRQGSIGVRVGQPVRVSDQIGSVGNSGNSSEPHLHIHAAKNPGPTGLGGIGVPIRFQGRFLVRNSLIAN